DERTKEGPAVGIAQSAHSLRVAPVESKLVTVRCDDDALERELRGGELVLAGQNREQFLGGATGCAHLELNLRLVLARRAECEPPGQEKEGGLHAGRTMESEGKFALRRRQT